MRWIREYIPFIMVGFVFIAAILSHFPIYDKIYVYLSDLVGYSVITNLFMISVYFNGRYCLATKVAVLALLVLNVLNMCNNLFTFYSAIYDVYISIFVSTLVIIFSLTKKSREYVVTSR